MSNIKLVSYKISDYYENIRKNSNLDQKNTNDTGNNTIRIVNSNTPGTPANVTPIKIQELGLYVGTTEKIDGYKVDRKALESDIVNALSGKPLTKPIKMLVIPELQDKLGKIVYLCPDKKQADRIINQKKCLALVLPELVDLAKNVRDKNNESITALLLGKVFGGKELSN